MTYIPYGVEIGGRKFRGAWKPFGYNQAPPGEYKASNPLWGLGGAAIGFGSTIARNWETIGAVGAAARAGFGAMEGGAVGGPAGAAVGAMAGLI